MTVAGSVRSAMLDGGRVAFFFFNDTAATEIYTLSLHDALPISALAVGGISVTDVDGNLSTVQLGVANGTVTVTLSGTATISAGGNGTNSLTLSGSQVDINTT